MLDSIRSAKESVEQEILSLSGVNGLGIGEHPTRPDELAILIYTDPGSDQADALKTPETVGFRGEQFATRREKMMPASAPPRNLQVTFEGAKQHSVVPNLTTFVRPATGGCSVANYAFPIGTLGIAVIDARNDNLTYLLSCNHVLARLNCAPQFDPILQPAPNDGGSLQMAWFGSLTRFVPISFGPQSANIADAAIAAVFPWNLSTGIHGIGRVTSHRSHKSLRPREVVRKVGRASGLTNGVLKSLYTTVSINYSGIGFPGISTWFINQIVTSPMAAYGDSGAILVDSDGRALGLLFAGSVTHTIHNPIDIVLQELEVALPQRPMLAKDFQSLE